MIPQTATGRQAGAQRRGYWFLALTCLTCLPAILWRSIVAQVSGLQSLAVSNPYFQPARAGLLYFCMPLVAVSSFIFYLAPGICIVLALAKVKNPLEQLMLSFGTSLLLSVVLETFIKLVPGTPLSADTFVRWWGAALFIAASFCLFRFSRREAVIMPFGRPELRRFVWMGLISAAAVAILIPKLFWENFNIDGTESFEFGRSLTTHVLPYWDIQGGVFGFYHNFLLFAYPNHWFIALFGPFEGSVRLTFVLYLVLLFATLVLLIEHGFNRGLRAIEEAALWLGLALFTILQAYNTTYDPFFTDIAEPGATDCMMLVCFLAACYFLWTGRLWCFALFAVATYLSTVGGSALLAALGVSILTLRSAKKWEYLKALGVVAFCCGFLAILHETIYNHIVLGGAKDQFSTRNMAARLFPPTVTHFYRLAAVLFPSGLLPAISVLAITPSDPIAWSTGVITILYTGAIYLQVWTALHQFTPAMVLPLIVFWRLYLKARAEIQPWLLAGIVATTGFCIALSLPRHFQINRAAREFGEATDFRAGDYDKGYETAVHAASSVLGSLLPADYRLQYPNQRWGMDHESWVYYAFHKDSPAAAANYIVQTQAASAPEDATLVATRDGFSVYVRDVGRWVRQRDRKLPQIVQSPLYEPILRHTCQFFRDYIAQQQRKTQSQ